MNNQLHRHSTANIREMLKHATLGASERKRLKQELKRRKP